MDSHLHARGFPAQWPYASNNSPLPLPEHPVLFTKEAVLWLDRFTGAMTENLLEGEALKAYVGSYGTGDGTLDELLEQAGAPPLRERRPILLQGELANPYRLQEMNMGPLPLIPFVLRAFAERGRTAWTLETPIPAFITSRWRELPVGGK